MSELMHFGVLGMRWGSRRGQLNRKNTMLTKGRQYSVDKRDLKRLENKKGFRSAHQKAMDAKKIEILKERVGKVKDQPVNKIPKKSIWEGKSKGEKILMGIGTFVVADIAVGTALSTVGGLFLSYNK
jgi:hypothetical protein